jgi:hypothetical protein
MNGKAVFLLALAAAAPAFSQSAAVVRSNSFEVGGFIGSSYGIDEFRVMGGANLTYALNKYILPYGEFSYFPGIGRVQKGVFQGTGRPFTLSYSVPLTDFHGGVHIRIPIKESKFVPYGVVGFGVLSSFDRTVKAQFQDASGTNIRDLQVSGSTDYATNFGGGIRYYINNRFGIRAEAKAYKPTGAFTDLFGKVEFGFFLQLR